MGHLFQIINRHDGGKRFIGYTTRSLSQVRASYYTQARTYGDNKGSSLFNALRTYPREAFEWTLISEDISDLDDLVRMRIEAIQELSTADPIQGYNVREGISVVSSLKSKRPARFRCLETGEAFSSPFEIAKVSGQCRQVVGQRIRSGKQIGGKTYVRIVGEVMD